MASQYLDESHQVHWVLALPGSKQFSLISLRHTNVSKTWFRFLQSLLYDNTTLSFLVRVLKIVSISVMTSVSSLNSWPSGSDRTEYIISLNWLCGSDSIKFLWTDCAVRIGLKSEDHSLPGANQTRMAQRQLCACAVGHQQQNMIRSTSCTTC